MRIIAITGMPGAGKSTAAKVLVGKGWRRVVMGDVIREEARWLGLEPDSKNTGQVMARLRREGGEAAVAELCLQTIEKGGYEKVVVDGIRSVVEVETFRRKAKVMLVAVHASPDRRFELLKERGRRDDPITREMFLIRDKRELGIGLGEAIALADEVVSNEHTTPGKLASEMIEVLGVWDKKFAP